MSLYRFLFNDIFLQQNGKVFSTNGNNKEPQADDGQ